MTASALKKGTKVRVHSGPYTGLSGTTDGYATMAGVKHLRIRLHDDTGQWTSTIYPLPAETEKTPGEPP